MRKTGESPFISFVDLLTGVILILLLIVVAFVLLPKEKGRTCKFVAEIQQEMSARGFKADADIKDCLIKFSTDQMFANGSVEIAAPLQAGIIKTFAEILHQKIHCYIFGENYELACKPENLKIADIFVEGHTDAKTYPYTEGNWRLSAARAAAFYRSMLIFEPTLENARAPPSVGDFLFGIAGYADLRPAIRPRVRDDEPRDRRIEIRFITRP